MVSISFPIRDHHKHYILWRFPRGTIVAKISAHAAFRSKKWNVTEFSIDTNVRIEEVTDPNTRTDVNPIKDGVSFTRHLVFALQKAIHREAVKTIGEDNDLTGGWLGNEERTRMGVQSFEFTPHNMLLIKGANTLQGESIYVSLHASLAEHMGVIAPGTAHTTNVQGRHICPVSRSMDVPLLVPASSDASLENYWQVETTWGGSRVDYIQLRNPVDWELIGLNDGWFEQVFNAKVHVLRIFSNICDRTVLGETRTNVLAEALVNAVDKTGQDYYEPTHPRYVPVRQRELDVIEIRLDDLSGHILVVVYLDLTRFWIDQSEASKEKSGVLIGREPRTT